MEMGYVFENASSKEEFKVLINFSKFFIITIMSRKFLSKTLMRCIQGRISAVLTILAFSVCQDFHSHIACILSIWFSFLCIDCIIQVLNFMNNIYYIECKIRI